jgi:hypothetical protein
MNQVRGPVCWFHPPDAARASRERPSDAPAPIPARDRGEQRRLGQQHPEHLAARESDRPEDRDLAHPLAHGHARGVRGDEHGAHREQHGHDRDQEREPLERLELTPEEALLGLGSGLASLLWKVSSISRKSASTRAGSSTRSQDHARAVEVPLARGHRLHEVFALEQEVRRARDRDLAEIVNVSAICP